MADTIRAFVSLNLPAELSAGILRVQRHFHYLPGASSMRWTPPGKLHLTLEFLGGVDAEKIAALTTALNEACVGQKPLKLEFQGAGCFPSFHKPSVAWLDITGGTNELCLLQKKIRAACVPFELKPDVKPFVPHLTIGRVKNGAFKTARVFGAALAREARGIAVDGIWNANRVMLMRSELNSDGARYTELAAIELRDLAADDHAAMNQR